MDKRLFREARLARFAFMATVGLSLIGGLLIIGQAFFLSRIISRVFLAGAGRPELHGLFVGLLLVIGLRALNQVGVQLTADSVAIRVKQALRRRLVDHLLKLGPAYTQQERSGELALTATKGIEALDSFFRDYLPALFTFLLVPLVILLFVLPIDLLTFFVLLITAPLIPIFMILIGQMAGALAQNRYAQLGQLSAHFLDVMQGLTTLKLFNRSQAQIGIIARMTDQYRQSTLAVLRIAFLSAFALELVAMLSIAVVAVEVGLRLLYGRILFEQALFLLVLAPDFYQPLRQSGAKFHAGRDEAAARTANAHTFIQQLPQGYDTIVGENGTRLSGGQAQRLALARALIRQPDLYIFDEATANLDSDNERAILHQLRHLTAGATVITIAHRLNTIRQADKIVVLDNGRIVESGTHAELVARRGAYFELLNT